MDSIFLYYASGVLMGEVDFQGEAFADSGLALMSEVWKEDGGQARWTSESVHLAGHVYERYMEMGRGWIYAELDSPTPVDIAVCEGQLAGFMIPGRNESRTYVREGYEDCTNLSLWQDSLLSPLCAHIQDKGTFMVPMRDGVHLAADVILPEMEEGEKVPAILIRTCYDKNKDREIWQRYAMRGYGVVIQDCRGREASEGEWAPFVNESEDGDDTLNWIAAQDWSDGSVGMLGGSYLGYVQWAAAASGNPHLKALVSQVTAGSPFVDLPRRGGTMGSGVLAWSMIVADRKTNPQGCVRDDWDELLRYRPISGIPGKALGRDIPFYNQWMEHPDYDSFWKRAAWEDEADRISVPALYISGWFDDDGPGTTMAWRMNQQRGRENQKMILGPWLHKTNSARRIHTYELGANALRYDLDVLYVKWFDRFLKGVENGIDLSPKVEYYMLGEGEWKTSECWPPREAQMTSLYLNAAKGGDIHQGSLDRDRSQRQEQVEYPFDPVDPFPYVIDVSENECAIPGDYTEAEKREDVLLFTSPVLTRELSIAGDVEAVLRASSSCKDTDFVVRLTDVGPDGRSVKLSDGILRARYRNSFEKPELLIPGKEEIYKISMTRIAHTFLRGHRIRIQVTSGADNLCFANSNTGGDETRAVNLVRACQTIYTGGERGSYVSLPVLRES